ncbi:hypothetical protein [Actinophytocola sp.]|jgi:hypothetical protein|uniref:hypothetical protein n=1 Tax=Actinophytocola sp. TaxID=1872138 RepID=UPI002ED8EBA7
MIELEDRLRAALTGLAEELPDSADPRAELGRRLDARRRGRRRGPALAAAAAAVVIAGVLVPVALNQDDQPPRTGSAATGGLPTTPATSAPRLPGLVVGPFELGRFPTSGGVGQAFGYFQKDRYCTTVVPDGGALEGATFTCEPLPRFPAAPANSLVQSRMPLNGDGSHDLGPLSDRLVFLADPRVATLTARRADGKQVPVRLLGRTDRVTGFLVDFGEASEGFGYTARDRDGTILEDAIT